ncbi:MAG: MarR family winged helix-turn-helix transcriptional regulator [Sporichthyaceae bacterium]
MEHVDPIEWSRRRWQSEGLPDAERFAAMATVLRTAQVVGADLDKALRPHELSRTAFLLLATVRIAPGCALPLGRLSRHLMLHPTTVTLTIEALEKRGVISREPHPHDRRTVLATLTAAGRVFFDEVASALAGDGYALSAITAQLAVTATEILRQVRSELGD